MVRMDCAAASIAAWPVRSSAADRGRERSQSTSATIRPQRGAQFVREFPGQLPLMAQQRTDPVQERVQRAAETVEFGRDGPASEKRASEVTALHCAACSVMRRAPGAARARRPVASRRRCSPA